MADEELEEIPEPATPQEISAVLSFLDALVEEAEKRKKGLDQQLISEAFSPKLSKRAVFDLALQTAQHELTVLRELRGRLEAHRPPPEPTITCNQCPEVFPLSKAESHREWHRTMSFQEEE